MSKKIANLEKWVVIPDAHAPYHDKRAFGLVLQVVEYYSQLTPVRRSNPGLGVVVLGDFCDFYKISYHSKDPARLLTFDDELKEAGKLLRKLEKHCHKNRVFVHGNHEFRLIRTLQDKVPELYNLVMTQDLLGLKANDWFEVPYKEDVVIGKVFVTHDVGQAGIHSTRQAMIAYQDNVIIGHNHRMDYHVQGNARGIPHVGASFGWLGDVDKIDYLHKMKARSNWALGFGWMVMDPETHYTYITPVPIVDYTCCVEGVVFRG